MIRPLTIATFLMALGSGLYLYQSKHEVELLDKTIERTVHETSALREQSRLLATEWTMLNDPERLRQFSDTYLNLRPIVPTQFTSTADLDSRLPAQRVEPPHVEEPVPVAMAAPLIATTDADTATPLAEEEALPVPPVPVPPPVPASASPRPPEHKIAAVKPAGQDSAKMAGQDAVRPAEAPRSVASVETRPMDQHPIRPAEPRTATPALAEARTPPQRPAALPVQAAAPVQTASTYSPPRQVAAPAPVAASVTSVASAAPYGGSLLGMARGSAPPAPRPVPVDSAKWN